MTGCAGGNGPGPREPLPPGGAAPPPAAAGPLRRVVRIVNPLGLHMRLADRFSRTARQYASAVVVLAGDGRADGKSLLDLILLSAMPGADVTLEVDGPDAAAAVDPLAGILGSPAGEDYTI